MFLSPPLLFVTPFKQWIYVWSVRGTKLTQVRDHISNAFLSSIALIWINDKINRYLEILFIILILECSGKVVLSSDYHDFPYEIQAEELKQRRGNRKKIKYRRDGRLLHFDYVEMTGNCRWSVWSKSRSGDSFQVDQPGIQEPGWPIRAVKLLI